MLARVSPSLKPPPKLKVSEWADRYRQLSRETSAEPGQYSTERVPHMREIMDAFCDPDVREVWVMKSAQIGYTTALENIIGYFADQDPSPVLLIQPTLQGAEDFSKTRLAPMVRDTPKLRGKFADAKSRDSSNTLLRKKFPGGHLILAGANAPSGLASHPIRVALFDEIDRYPASAGTEGDPLSLGIKRTVAFWNRKIGGGSTPGIKGASLIEAKFEGSDQRRRFVPCPHCGEEQTLKWSQVKFDSADPATARYGCEHCGVLWDDVERWGALLKATWKATKPFRGIAGFHMNEIVSMFVRLEDMVRAFLEAKKSPEKLKTFTNTSLAETWEEAGTTVEHGSLLERVETYSAKSIPEGVLMLTVGGDTQDDRVELQLLGWGADEECWILEQEVKRGDPDSLAFWKGEVDPYLKQRFVTEDGRELAIEAAAIDSGGQHTQRVYDFVKSLKRRRVWAIKGKAGPGVLAWPKKVSRGGKGRANLFIVGVDTIKSILYGRLRLVNEPGPSYIHFPASVDEEFCKQLTSEKAKTKFIKGRPSLVWEPRAEGIKQEAQDCWLYGYAAMIGRGGLKHLQRLATGKVRTSARRAPTVIDQSTEEASEAAEPATPTPPSPPRAAPVRAAPRPTGRFPRKGWFRR
jgi:phage terminase large subunit GpA-like protein